MEIGIEISGSGVPLDDHLYAPVFIAHVLELAMHAVPRIDICEIVHLR